jgi:hypothetical protein
MLSLLTTTPTNVYMRTSHRLISTKRDDEKDDKKNYKKGYHSGDVIALVVAVVAYSKATSTQQLLLKIYKD